MLGVLDDHKMPPGQMVPGTVLLDKIKDEGASNLALHHRSVTEMLSLSKDRETNMDD
jgi:hypothetical protein